MNDLFFARTLFTLALLALTSCGGGDEPAPKQASGPMCGPCDMTMPADYPLKEIAGMKFAICGGRCEELISADPEKYREFAVTE